MPKMKSVKSIMAKFRKTGTGKLKRNHPGKGHLLSGKSPKTKRKLARAAITDRAHTKVYSLHMSV